ncbi:trifolitoxin synthesis, TfuA [Sphingomonas solaris]|uniref:Trifolitoxin synthesis, TfuA n=1 Tax=Alterirhizorhabdus solaris TaxID=2529389 RepID=A0A558R7L3_9SPHN|nr:trifolitoxin synthesis, TfuA [Sphingomonas solaris]TVV75391.1 trifolitoxin synthesis, TfuA [Sphingomonas solaris]
MSVAEPDSRSRDPAFLIRLYGDCRVVDCATGADATPKSRKARALLAYLALVPDHCAGRERLTGLLWSDRGEEQARASLRQTLAELRGGAIGLALAITRRDVSLVASVVDNDIARVVSAAQGGDLARLYDPLNRLGATLLGDLEGTDRCFDDWLLVERPRQQGRIVQAVLAAAAGVTTPGTLPLRRAILTTAQALDTGDEEIARCGMAMDHEAGDLAALHRRYRQLDAGLKRDYDAPPSPETQRLFRQLTAVGPVNPVAPPPVTETPSLPGTPIAVGPGTRRIEPPILVISPFAVMGDGSDETLLARICHDDLQTALGGFRDLRVLSIAESGAGRLDAACAASIASYALSGSVRGQGRDCRINLRLTAIESGLLVWTRQLPVGQTSLGAAIDDLVARIAGAILPVVERDVSRVLGEAHDTDPAAYALYFGGRARLLTAASLDEVRAAADLFERAIEADPSLTNAYIELARLYNTDFVQRMAGHDPAPMRARAFELSLKAASLDPDSGHVHSRLAWCYLRRGDVALAEQRFAAALEAGPYHADGLDEAGFGLVHLGAFDRAGALLARAFELNPFPPDEYFSDMAVLLALRHEHLRAEEQFEISRNPSIHYLAIRVANLALLGRGDQAHALGHTLRARFAPLWRAAGNPGDADLVEGMFRFLPFHRAEDRDTLVHGLRAAGFAC